MGPPELSGTNGRIPINCKIKLFVSDRLCDKNRLPFFNVYDFADCSLIDDSFELRNFVRNHNVAIREISAEQLAANTVTRDDVEIVASRRTFCEGVDFFFESVSLWAGHSFQEHKCPATYDGVRVRN